MGNVRNKGQKLARKVLTPKEAENKTSDESERNEATDVSEIQQEKKIYIFQN